MKNRISLDFRYMVEANTADETGEAIVVLFDTEVKAMLLGIQESRLGENAT